MTKPARSCQTCGMRPLTPANVRICEDCVREFYRYIKDCIAKKEPVDATNERYGKNWVLNTAPEAALNER